MRVASEPSTPPFAEPTGVNPADKSADLSSPLHQYGQYLLTCLPKYIQQFSVYKDELTLYIPPTAVVPTLTFLRDHSQCQYKQVMDITAVDFPTRAMRFEASGHDESTPRLTMILADCLQLALGCSSISNQGEDLCRRGQRSSVGRRRLFRSQLV